MRLSRRNLRVVPRANTLILVLLTAGMGFAQASSEAAPQEKTPAPLPGVRVESSLVTQKSSEDRERIQA